jgi:predicted RNA-binding protein with RPS1 domain
MVTKLVTFGAFARIEGPVEGLIHVSELVDRRIAHPKEVVREGDLLPLKIVRIERDRHRLGLSLRDAREEGERMGFRFTDGGEVMEVPDDVRKEFEEREGVTVPEREPIVATAAETSSASDGTTAEATVAPTERPAAAAAPAPAREREPEEPVRSAMADALHASGAAEAFRDEPAAREEPTAAVADVPTADDTATAAADDASAAPAHDVSTVTPVETEGDATPSDEAASVNGNGAHAEAPAADEAATEEEAATE